MKKSVVGLILLSFLLQTCRDDEPVNTGNVQFAFSASSLVNPGGRSLSYLTDGAMLVVSISKSNGDPVYTLKELSLLKLGDQFISSPLTLPRGNYTITDFLVANVDHEVLYATPKEGSPLASLVEHPLPIAFSIDENEITDLEVEIVSVEAHQAEEFGYVSFSINIVPVAAFKLSVFIPGENGTFELSGAQAYILHEDDTIYDQHVLPSVNNILFDGNSTDSYTLVLIEPSYKKYSRTFTLTDLDHQNENPLTVILTPAFTFTMMLEGTATEFEFNLTPGDQFTSSTLSVDWGDGEVEEIPFDYNDPYMTHTYASSGGTHFVSVSGDLDLMENLNLSYSYITDISLRYLPELKDFAFSAAHTPATVDLSHNTKLEFVNFLLSRSLTSLDISNNTSVKAFYLLCNNDFTVESLDMVIHNLLRNASEFGVTGGYFSLQRCDGPVNEWAFIGPPSPAALEELRELRDTYGWTIAPEEVEF